MDQVSCIPRNECNRLFVISNPCEQRLMEVQFNISFRCENPESCKLLLMASSKVHLVLHKFRVKRSFNSLLKAWPSAPHCMDIITIFNGPLK